VRFLLYGPLPLGLLLLIGFASAAEKPLYDDRGDARQQVASAIADAARSQRNVVILFGANW
jgi:hypothetical protein